MGLPLAPDGPRPGKANEDDADGCGGGGDELIAVAGDVVCGARIADRGGLID